MTSLARLPVASIRSGLEARAKFSQPATLRDTWPTFLTIPGRDDDVSQRLKPGEAADGELHVYDEHGLPSTLAVTVRVTLASFLAVAAA